MAEIRDDRGDQCRVQLLGDRPEEFLGHPGPRHRRDRVHLDVVLRAFLGEHPCEADDPHLRGPVVGLTDVAENPGGGGGVDDPAVALLAHPEERRLGHPDGAVEMDIDHRIE